MQSTPCGTRARNLRIRSPTPCPLGQGGSSHSRPEPLTTCCYRLARSSRLPPARARQGPTSVAAPELHAQTKLNTMVTCLMQLNPGQCSSPGFARRAPMSSVAAAGRRITRKVPGRAGRDRERLAQLCRSRWSWSLPSAPSRAARKQASTCWRVTKHERQGTLPCAAARR